MRKGYRILVYVVGAWVALLAVSIGSCAVKTSKLNRAYTQVKIGDSRPTVVAALGEPSQIDNCVGPDEKPPLRCFEHFITLLSRTDGGLLWTVKRKFRRSTSRVAFNLSEAEQSLDRDWLRGRHLGNHSQIKAQRRVQWCRLPDQNRKACR